jgi:hypothetical protein
MIPGEPVALGEGVVPPGGEGEVCLPVFGVGVGVAVVPSGGVGLGVGGGTIDVTLIILVLLVTLATRRPLIQRPASTLAG